VGGAKYNGTLTGTHTGPGGTGRKIHISGFERWRIGEDGLIASSEGWFDAAEYQRQMTKEPARGRKNDKTAFRLRGDVASGPVRWSVPPVTVKDFRRIALSLDGVEESSHMGQPDFRVGGRIFATLAAAEKGYGNLMLTPDQQATFVEELPEVFIPVAGGWGKNGATHIRLAAANKDVLEGALRTAWKLRLEKNRRSGKKKTGASSRSKRDE